MYTVEGISAMLDLSYVIDTGLLNESGNFAAFRV